MTAEIEKLSGLGRRAWAARDWPTVEACAARILQLDASSAEGYFFTGLVEHVATRPVNATQAFEKVLSLDPSRYDAAIELAAQHSIGRRNGKAAALIAQYESQLGNSPHYLDLAGTVYTEIGLAEKAWPLYRQASELQPEVDLFLANLAACSVYLGKIDDAREMYKKLLTRFPNHQRNHYYLARLEKASNDQHVKQMEDVLRRVKQPEDKNVFIYYALGKELEDLGRWREAFKYYKKAGDAVTAIANYDIDSDLKLIDTIIAVCNRDWVRVKNAGNRLVNSGKTPIFIVGLPRTGTTLTERIISSHSGVQSLGETQFMQMVLRSISGIKTVEMMNAAIIEAAATQDIEEIGKGYLDAVSYRLGSEPMFIDKLPFNFLFLGFIAKAFPQARIVHLVRNPLDSCFAMYKQVFTWAYKFSYSLDNLGQYFVAHERLRRHWVDVLGDRIIEIEYESLVSDQETQTRMLLDRLGLPFEQSCLDFDKNKAASTTASSVQVREKMHTRSINRWTHFADELQVLNSYLEKNGIVTR
jgi:tetratricopeptide (TPR) repeat protein